MALFVLFQIFYHNAEFGNSFPVNFRKANIQPRTQGLSLGKTLASAGHVIPRI